MKTICHCLSARAGPLAIRPSGYLLLFRCSVVAPSGCALPLPPQALCSYRDHASFFSAPCLCICFVTWLECSFCILSKAASSQFSNATFPEHSVRLIAPCCVYCRPLHTSFLGLPHAYFLY